MATGSTALAPAKPHSRITRDDFCNWTKTCRACRIQQRHMDVVKEAEASGITPEEQVHKMGYKDFAALHRDCPRFSIWCSTSELAELGVGFVLYFRLLRFLALVLFLLGLFQIPAMVTYSGSHRVSYWWYLTDWRRAYASDRGQRCGCLGDNRGVLGPSSAFQDPSYGTTCGAWDVDACFAPTAAGVSNSPFAHPGKWCCRSWCFADPICPESDHASSPSLSARWYSGMIRATAVCLQNATLLAERCGSLADTAFGEFDRSNLAALAGNFIGIWWLTPGNLGPGEASSTHILAMYVICVLLLCLCIIAHRQFQIRTTLEVDSKSVMPNDFAIMVKGLPATETDEGVIADFFRKHAVKGQDSTEVVKVVIGWDAGSYRGKMKELSKARASLRKKQNGESEACDCCCGSAQAAEDESVLVQRITMLKKNLYEAAPEDSEKLLSSGTVVVVFRWQKDLRMCLRRWQSFWQWWSYCEPAASGLWSGEPLPSFGETNAKLTVTRAANPGDIHWEELGHSTLDQSKLWMKTSSAMLVLIAGGFALSWVLNRWQADVKESNTGVSYAQQLFSLLPALVITIVNFLLRTAGRIFGEMEYQETWGQQEFSQGVKMTFSMIINTGCVVLFINAQPTEWYRKGGLVDDVFYMLLVDSIVARLCLFSDITYTFNYYFRRKLTDGKLQQMNGAMVQNLPRKTAEQEEALEELTSEIEGFKQAFEPEEIDNPDRYARVLTTFLCSVFFAPVFPASVFIGMIGLLLQYFLDKILLLKWYKRPRPQNEVQAKWSLQMLKVCAPLALTSGAFIFLTPSWSDKSAVLKFFITCVIISLILAAFPSRLLPWVNIFGWISRCWRRRVEEDSDASRWQDYYHAQFMWPKDMKYHMDQPLYKQLNRVSKEKNPAILTREADHRVAAADLKANFTASVKAVVALDAVAARKGFNRRGRPPRKRASTLAVPTGREPDEEAPSDAVPLCLREGCGKPTWNGQPNQHCGRTCRELDGGAPGSGRQGVAPEDVAVEPIAVEAAVQWMYEAEGGYKAYADDCQSFIESRYQVFLSDPSRTQATVKTGGTMLVLDFAHMSQRLKDGKRERTIKRVAEGA